MSKVRVSRRQMLAEHAALMRRLVNSQKDSHICGHTPTSDGLTHRLIRSDGFPLGEAGPHDTRTEHYDQLEAPMLPDARGARAPYHSSAPPQAETRRPAAPAHSAPS
jgi:hypothetical protein